jgi:hypothetical protein
MIPLKHMARKIATYVVLVHLFNFKMKEYFYVLEGQQHGPVSADEFMQIGIGEDTLVWSDGMAEWTPANMLPEFQRLVPPPLPTANTQQPIAPDASIEQPYVSSTESIPLVNTAMPAIPAPSSKIPNIIKILTGLVLCVLIDKGCSGSSNASEAVITDNDTEATSAVSSEGKHTRKQSRKFRNKDENDMSDNATSNVDTDVTEVTPEDDAPSRVQVEFGNGGSNLGTNHSEGNGEKEYTCYFCSATKLSKDRPDRGRCPQSPKKDEMSGYGHQWEESGKPVNRY